MKQLLIKKANRTKGDKRNSDWSDACANASAKLPNGFSDCSPTTRAATDAPCPGPPSLPARWTFFPFRSAGHLHGKTGARSGGEAVSRMTRFRLAKRPGILIPQGPANEPVCEPVNEPVDEPVNPPLSDLGNPVQTMLSSRRKSSRFTWRTPVSSNQRCRTSSRTMIFRNESPASENARRSLASFSSDRMA